MLLRWGRYLYSLPPADLRATLATLAPEFEGDAAIDGVFFGDELVAPYTNISAVVSAARAALGPNKLLCLLRAMCYAFPIDRSFSRWKF